MYYSGGALSKYGESGRRTEGIIPLEPEGAYEWLERNDCFEVIDKYFSVFFRRRINCKGMDGIVLIC